MKTIKVIIIGAAVTIGSVLTSCEKNNIMPGSTQSASDVAETEDSPKPAKGKIKDKQTSAVAGATIYLYHNPGTTPLDTATSNNNGEFVFPLVSPGNYRVHVTASGFEDVDVYFAVPEEGTEYEMNDIIINEEEE